MIRVPEDGCYVGGEDSVPVKDDPEDRCVDGRSAEVGVGSGRYSTLKVGSL
jgi:hypothetical protein